MDSHNLRQLGSPTGGKRSPGTGNTGASMVGDLCSGDNRQTTCGIISISAKQPVGDPDCAFPRAKLPHLRPWGEANVAVSAIGLGGIKISEEDRDALAEFIRSKGITRCPTACVLPTQGLIAATGPRWNNTRFCVIECTENELPFVGGDSHCRSVHRTIAVVLGGGTVTVSGG